MDKGRLLKELKIDIRCSFSRLHCCGEAAGVNPCSFHQ